VESKQDWPQFSLEEAVRLQPEYLVFASSHSETVKNDVEALAAKPAWSAMERGEEKKNCNRQRRDQPGPGHGLWTPWKNWRGNFIPNYLRRKIDAAADARPSGSAVRDSCSNLFVWW